MTNPQVAMLLNDLARSMESGNGALGRQHVESAIYALNGNPMICGSNPQHMLSYLFTLALAEALR